MLHSGIEKFKVVIQSIANGTLVKKDICGNSIEVEFRLNSLAQDSELIAVRKELSLELPSSFKSFLKIHNGGEIYSYNRLDGFKIFGTNEIIEVNKLIANEYGKDWINNIIIFAECLGEGNYLGFKSSEYLEEYEVLDCFHEELPINWKTIARSFDTFLDHLILHNGNKFWLK